MSNLKPNISAGLSPILFFEPKHFLTAHQRTTILQMIWHYCQIICDPSTHPHSLILTSFFPHTSCWPSTFVLRCNGSTTNSKQMCWARTRATRWRQNPKSQSNRGRHQDCGKIKHCGRSLRELFVSMIYFMAVTLFKQSITGLRARP